MIFLGRVYSCYYHSVGDSSAANIRVLCVTLMSISPVCLGESPGPLGTGGSRFVWGYRVVGGFLSLIHCYVDGWFVLPVFLHQLGRCRFLVPSL